jgi:hypothetical protein
MTCGSSEICRQSQEPASRLAAGNGCNDRSSDQREERKAKTRRRRRRMRSGNNTITNEIPCRTSDPKPCASSLPIAGSARACVCSVGSSTFPSGLSSLLALGETSPEAAYRPPASYRPCQRCGDSVVEIAPRSGDEPSTPHIRYDRGEDWGPGRSRVVHLQGEDGEGGQWHREVGEIQHCVAGRTCLGQARSGSRESARQVAGGMGWERASCSDQAGSSSFCPSSTHCSYQSSSAYSGRFCHWQGFSAA